MAKLTPMMEQYMSLKEQYKDSILFFRLGDFYEMFFEDALIASRELEITLTKRDAGMEEKAPMCGVPHHVADTYIAKLVQKGYKVAICEQMEDPSEAKGIVRRDVVKVITPGTVTDQNLLDEKSNNFLASIYMDDMGYGIAYVDNSTGEMYTTEDYHSSKDNFSSLIDELGKINPSEIVCNEMLLDNKNLKNIIKNTIDPYMNVYKDEEIDISSLNNSILGHFKEKEIEEIALKEKTYSVIATGKLLDYLHVTQKSSLDHINSLSFYKTENYMILDFNTRANLEIHETIIRRDKKGALIGVLDRTSTSMGARLLKKWLEQPLLSIDEIENRNKAVEYFFNDIIFMDDINELLRHIYDIERLATKISNGSCNGRDLISIKSSISVLPELKSKLMRVDNKELLNLGINLDVLEDIYKLIDISIKEDPPISVKEGSLIKQGYNEELDKVRLTSTEGKEWLADLELEEKKKTGIKNLKIGFNKISGYFFEVTKSNIPMVPDRFVRKQTLTNSERYHTEKLKSMENEILGAEEKILDLEYKLFQEVRDDIKSKIVRIQNTSRIVAKIDVLNSLSKIAYDLDFIKPKFNRKGIIDIKEGRHPVVEKTIENNLFIPNDTHLNKKDNMIQIITGPNMSGKSTYMRQVAIITLLAHIGSFVPAESADICIVDRIFTRIGAADNLSQGKSTFMVEMMEVSNIVRSATKDSLIILDEVGRGTSTYDGLSIAWALVEHIADNIKAKTLFATHYHELTQLEEKSEHIKNLTILAEKENNEIVFLRKIVEGSTNKSYGIEVAKLAGIDSSITRRSDEILSLIEGNHKIDLSNTKVKENKQIDMADFQTNYYIDRILNLDIDNMTPRNALDSLYELIEDAEKLRRDSDG